MKVVSETCLNCIVKLTTQAIENERDLHLNKSQWSLLLGFQARGIMSRGHNNILCDTVYRCCCIYVCKGTCGCCQGADSKIKWLWSYVTLIQVPQERLYILLSISHVMNTLPTHNWLARCRWVPVNGPYLPLQINSQPRKTTARYKFRNFWNNAWSCTLCIDRQNFFINCV